MHNCLNKVNRFYVENKQIYIYIYIQKSLVTQESKAENTLIAIDTRSTLAPCGNV